VQAKKQRATVPTDGPSNGRNLKGEKEMTGALSVVVTSGKHAGTSPITVRWYMGRSNSASVVYCSVWAMNNTHYAAGHGKAGGYGYCKESASFDCAVRSAGIELSSSVDGVGRSAIHEACEAIARAMGIRGHLVYVTS